MTSAPRTLPTDCTARQNMNVCACMRTRCRLVCSRCPRNVHTNGYTRTHTCAHTHICYAFREKDMRCRAAFRLLCVRHAACVTACARACAFKCECAPLALSGNLPRPLSHFLALALARPLSLSHSLAGWSTCSPGCRDRMRTSRTQRLRSASRPCTAAKCNEDSRCLCTVSSTSALLFWT